MLVQLRYVRQYGVARMPHVVVLSRLSIYHQHPLEINPNNKNEKLQIRRIQIRQQMEHLLMNNSGHVNVNSDHGVQI